jgi:hypothetical protein
MGNLCCKETNSAPIIAPSTSDNNKPADHKPAEKKKKEVKPPSNNTADLLGLVKEKEIIVVEEKAIEKDEKKPELDKKSNILEKFEFSLPFNQVNILAFC